MTRPFGAIAALALAISVSAAPAQQPAAPAPSLDRGLFVAIGGQTQSGRASCVQCHGLEGHGDGAAFPVIAGLGDWYLYKALRDYAAGLRPSPVMQPIASALSDREMQDVAAHYAAQPAGAAPPFPVPDIAVRQAGAALVAVGLPGKGIPACSSCHGPDGAGGADMTAPRIAGQLAPYVQHQLNLWRDGTRDGDPMNVMERIAKRMGDEEIRAVSLYLATVDPAFVKPPPADPIPVKAEAPKVLPPWLDGPAAESGP
jgi:cytochrome c553